MKYNGQEVRHRTKEEFGKGTILELSLDGKTAVVKFPDYPEKKSAWENAYVGHFKTADLIKED